MKKHLVLFVFLVAMVFCFSSCVYADTVRYIATNLIDKHGNPASGYLEINKSFSYDSYDTETIAIKNFNFSSYDSSTGRTYYSNSGSGSITNIFAVDLDVDGVKVERDPQNAIITLTGDSYSWRYVWGIYFLDQSKEKLALTDANYSTPPPYFKIYDGNYSDSDWYIKANGSSDGWMMFQAVPIPPAFLLFGSGLLGLIMVKRNKA